MKKTVSAGGVIVKVENGKVKVLLLGTDENKYFLPKGHVDGNETLEEAAYREVFEEAGLKEVKIECFLGQYQRINEEMKEDKNIHYFLMFVNKEEEHVRSKDNEGLHFKWFNIDDLPDFYLEEQEDVIKKNTLKIKEMALNLVEN